MTYEPPTVLDRIRFEEYSKAEAAVRERTHGLTEEVLRSVAR